VARDDWCRNSSWGEAVAARFEDKLRRSRNKHQYLRIQAASLVVSHPEVALALLERYFSLGDSLDTALAYQVRADAYLALNRIDDAIVAYEAAIRQEAVRPTVQTWASVDFPYLVAVRNLTPHFARALEILSSCKQALVFPVIRFKAHAAVALILAAQGEATRARIEARAALRAANEERAEFERHPNLGLVSKAHSDAITRLKSL
jgi:tetratricopeptide (TPR) repeat protein